MRKSYIALGIFLMITLNGCAKWNNFIENKILEESGILENDSYIEYQNMVKSGNVNEEGLYVQKSDEAEKTGSIHATFAINSNLNIEYYKDANKSKRIDTSSYYLNPGNSIYAEVEVSKDISDMYEFSSFDIYEYNDAEEKMYKSDLNSDFVKTGVVVQIPDDYTGTEISIVPVGKYNSREILLRDYYIDDSETEHDLNGTWLVNDVEYISDSVEINPLSSYIISYQYDSNEYFYVSAEPECYYINSDDGTLIFKQRTATDATMDYSVILSKYISASVVSRVDRTVKVNNEEVQNIKANEEFIISKKLKYGDKVFVETNKEWKELENIKENLICINIEPLSSGFYKYTLNVPEKGGEFKFDPSEYVYAHGSLTFRCFGITVDEIQYLAKGSKIYYEEKTAEEGYWLSNGEHYIVVGEDEETKQQLNNIHFIQKVQVSVNLKQPVYGGEIIYYIDGKKILSDHIDTYSGTVISMDFEPWEGWKCDNTDGVKYTVNGNSKQTVTINRADVNSIFTEDNEHKPELTVVLEKSVGKEMLFEISASGLEVDENSYQEAWYRSDYKIVDAQKIGTEEDIAISMKNKAIPSGEAVKIVVEKTDIDKKTDTEIRYIDDLTKLQEPIYIYSDLGNENSKVWYKSINITISRVDVQLFTAFQTDSYATITVKNETTKELLKEGDFIEDSQKVIVTITPQEGYYILDGNYSDDTKYQETLKYSKYLSKIEKIISNHPAKKFCEVTLDESDSFADYTYTSDKKNVSGNVKCKQGEKLTLEYEIIDDSHKLKEAAGGVLGIGKSDKKITKSIEVTTDYDGKIITKADFGIEVEERE